MLFYFVNAYHFDKILQNLFHNTELFCLQIEKAILYNYKENT